MYQRTSLWRSVWDYIAVGNTNSSAAKGKKKTEETSANYGLTLERAVMQEKSTGALQKNRIDGEHLTANWVSGLILCLWDNIFGPRIERVWNGCELLSESTQLHIARHLLCGEIGDSLDQNASEPLPCSKFYLFPTHGYMLSAVTFSAPYGGSRTQFGLVMVLASGYVEQYFHIQHIIQDRLFQLVATFRTLLDAKSIAVAVQAVSQRLPSVICNIERIYYSSTLLTAEGGNVLPFSSTLLHSNQADFSFMAKCITSLLQTHGCAIIIGSIAEDVNKMISTLSLFLSRAEKKRISFYAGYDTYVADLSLQGLTTSIRIQDEDVIQSLLPSTLINMDSQVVKQTHPYHIYEVLRREYLAQQIEKLNSNLPFTSANLWTAQSGLFHPLKNPSPIICNMLVELFRLPHFLREGYLCHFLRLLERKTVVMIKYAEAKMNISPRGGLRHGAATGGGGSEQDLTSMEGGKGMLQGEGHSSHRELLPGGSGRDGGAAAAAQSPPPPRSAPLPPLSASSSFSSSSSPASAFASASSGSTDLVGAGAAGPEAAAPAAAAIETSGLKTLRKDLELSSDEDFFVLLGIAERVSPGIYFALAGDPSSIEEKFIELFESF